jgi:hypothetical protein
MTRGDGLEELHDRKDEVFTAVVRALESAGLSHVFVSSMTLFVRSEARCPPGTSPTLESVALPDGSVKFQWVCR